ncbi:MAG: pyridoxamine 5'-phosphate oxidase family protein [Pseudolysinimonas sp.]
MTMVREFSTAFLPDHEVSAKNDETPGLTGAECWHLLGHSGIGRLEFTGDEGTRPASISYLAHAGCVYFRSTPGAALTDLPPQSRVEVTIDGESETARWNVVMRGRARPLRSDQDVARAGIKNVRAWQSGGNDNYFELRPDRITGRLVQSRGMAS